MERYCRPPSDLPLRNIKVLMLTLACESIASHRETRNFCGLKRKSGSAPRWDFDMSINIFLYKLIKEVCLCPEESRSLWYIADLQRKERICLNSFVRAFAVFYTERSQKVRTFDKIQYLWDNIHDEWLLFSRRKLCTWK